MTVSFHNAKAADGPGLYEWLERKGALAKAQKKQDVRAKTLARWRDGVWPAFYTVDRILISLDLHPTEVPEHLWRASRDPEQAYECENCGSGFMAGVRGKRPRWCSRKCRNAARFGMAA